jgi:hypothetical protein
MLETHRQNMNGTCRSESPESCFSSPLPFDGNGCGVAAVFCSDGRFAGQINDFLQNGLGLYGYDRLALAGGPACFAGHFAAYREEEGAVSHLQFLTKLHGLNRLILISHEDCGFYRDFLRIREMDLLDRMRLDLAGAARRIGAATPQLRIDAYLARLTGALVWFERIIVGN